MDFLLELIFEVILEGTVEASTERKIPLVHRIVAITILLVIAGALLGVCVAVTILCFKRNDVVSGISVIATGLFLFSIIAYGIIKKYKEKNKK